MKWNSLEANTKGLLIGNKNTFKTGFCKCELLSYEKSPANWRVGFDLKMQFLFRGIELEIRFPTIRDRHYFRHDPALMMRKERHLWGCLIRLITAQNVTILILHDRKRSKTLVRVLQSENGECHEMIIMEPLWKGETKRKAILNWSFSNFFLAKHKNF